MIPPIAPGQVDEKQSMVGWKNTFNMRQVTFMNLANAQLGVKNGSRPNFPNHKRPYSITSPTKSLDLLRKNLQSAINKDIDNVIKKYLEKFFQPAVINIKNNLGKDSVNEDHIKEVCKHMLEDAKLMYQTSPVSRDSSPYDCSDSEASTTDGRFGRNSPVHGKRKESDIDLETNLNQKRHKVKYFHTTDVSNYRLPIKREAPKWNSERITRNTLFIMGARANKVLGYGQTRGRLYVRHPELVRYSGDQEDKEWLASKNLMPPSGGKAYLMLLEDIQELTQSDDYRSNPNLQLHELKGFEVPLFLMVKIKNFIESVRTDKKPFIGLDLFDFRSQSLTPPNITLDSAPSTPSDTAQQVESQQESLSSKSENNYITLPDMSPNSNNSLMSTTLTQSPIPVNNSLFSPSMMMSIANSDSPNSITATVMMKDAAHNDSCLSNLLLGQMTNDNSQSF